MAHKICKRKYTSSNSWKGASRGVFEGNFYACKTPGPSLTQEAEERFRVS